MKPYCQCGQVFEDGCDGEPEPYPVKILWMPRYLREQHRTLGRTSIHESDGAIILKCNPSCAWNILDVEGSWAEEA